MHMVGERDDPLERLTVGAPYGGAVRIPSGDADECVPATGGDLEMVHHGHVEM